MLYIYILCNIYKITNYIKNMTYSRKDKYLSIIKYNINKQIKYDLNIIICIFNIFLNIIYYKKYTYIFTNFIIKIIYKYLKNIIYNNIY